MTKQNEKDAKRVPELRFKGFTDDWEQRKLGEIATIVGGGTPSTKNPEYWDGDINWYSPAEIGNQIYTEKSERQITELGLKKSSAKLLPVGTVLFTSRAGIGKTAILNKEACTNQGFQSIIPRSKMLNSYFLFSRTNSLKQYGETMGSGSTFVEVSGKQMSKMPLFIPNINEQSRIAKLFQSLDKTITLHEEKQCQLEQLKKALLQKMFADETGYPVLRFKGFTEKWEQRKLGEIGSFRSGVGFPESEQGGTAGIPFYKVSDMNLSENNTVMNISSNYVTDDQISRNKWKPIDGNTIIFAKVGAAVFLERKRQTRCKFLIDNNMMSYKPNSIQDHDYIYYTFQNLNLSHYAQIGSLPSLNAGELKNVNIVLPDQNERSKVSQLFLNLDRTITLHDKKIQYLKQLKRGLLQKMFV